MPSNLDLLREGQAVEFEPGLSGRLNKEKKTLELSNGRILNVAHDNDYFPRDQQQLNLSKQKQSVEKKAKGPVGEFLHQYSNQGIPGGIGDWRSYLTQTGEEYATRKQAERQVSQRISEESPYISAGATAANIATDVALTRGMSGVQAAPLLTLGSAGSRLATNPGEVMGETALSAVAGKGVDMLGNYFSGVAKRRGAIRDIPIQQQNVKNSNIAGEVAVNDANALQNQQFNALKQNTKTSNETKLKQYQDDLNIRKNQIVNDKNAYEQSKLARDTEIVRLKNQAQTEKMQRSANASKAEAEYQSAKQAADLENKRMADKFKQDQVDYQRATAELPELQKQAQREYSENVVKNAEGISNAFPKESRIDSSQLGVNEFIEQSLQKSGRAASKESNQASRILKSIIPEGEILTGKELATRYKALEDSIQRASPEVRGILNEFKSHMGDRLPNILADNIAYNRVVPAFQSQIQREISSILDKMQLVSVGGSSRSFLKDRMNSNLNQVFRELSPQDFVKKMQSGEVKQLILDRVIRPQDFLGGMSHLDPKNLKKLNINTANLTEGKSQEFMHLFNQKLDKALAKAELKMIAVDVDAANKLGAKVRKTYGYAENVSPPNPPVAPGNIPAPQAPAPIQPGQPITLPPPVTPPVLPPIPQKPSMIPNPTAPTPQSFTPQGQPMLSPSNGLTEQMGDFMEKKLLGGNSSSKDPLTQIIGKLEGPARLAGLKYFAGKATLPIEALYTGMKGLTSPTAAGEAARMTFKQGGIQAVESWAEKYPSFNNGVLQDPQERRSLTKEIEDDFQIPIEQKAIMQSKVNRGIPLQARL